MSPVTFGPNYSGLGSVGGAQWVGVSWWGTVGWGQLVGHSGLGSVGGAQWAGASWWGTVGWGQLVGHSGLGSVGGAQWVGVSRSGMGHLCWPSGVGWRGHRYVASLAWRMRAHAVTRRLGGVGMVWGDGRVG